jgi:23S rRNA pseudouridine1911/1915/1917 synthase
MFRHSLFSRNFELTMPRSNSTAKEQTFHVTDERENQTLAAALRGWIPNQSWSKIRQLIESRHVTVNGNLCVDAGRRLKTGEVVKVLSRPAPALPKSDDVVVQYLDEHVVVVEKPAGTTSNRHREETNWPARRKQLQPTLDELLPHVITKIEGRRGTRGVPLPVRAVHRLDRETSGIMVFARNHAAERKLAEQFRHHTTHRRYLAIVDGKVTAQTITSHLVRDRGDGRRGSAEKSGGKIEPSAGKLALTHVKPIEILKAANPGANGYSLIQCRLETGRTHQIRIHLSESGHPVCGDKLYRQPPFGKVSPDKSGAPRLALHAAELGFVHPVTGKTLRFQAPLPPELAEFWQQLKAKHAGTKKS